MDEKHGQVSAGIGLAQRQIYVLSLHMPTFDTPHPSMILQCLLGFMHLDTMLIPELLYELRYQITRLILMHSASENC